jgi:3-oxoacyl-[acyl-carrier protein] reductase
MIATEMNSHFSEETVAAIAEETPLCRIGTAEEVAALVAFLASEDAAFITGQVILQDGGFANC